MNGHSPKLKRLICEELGQDLGEELCDEVQRHLDDCPDCWAEFDSIKRTVYIYRKTHTDPEQLPGAVVKRLFKVLSLTPPAGKDQPPGTAEPG
ncbi:MAG: hypothetical protein IID13_02585 [Candidatus Marinimicrobia bacterium]|nr:hypothetical protein [Candidatus Neomarinimicrobiota bacterium]